MTKQEKEYLKEHAPWDYEAFYGDPVTGFTGSNNDGCGVAVLIVGILVICGLRFLFN
jgi:hypothetical protein